jgi:hypothetical protein
MAEAGFDGDGWSTAYRLAASPELEPEGTTA